jgi:hypothetical protein
MARKIKTSVRGSLFGLTWDPDKLRLEYHDEGPARFGFKKPVKKHVIVDGSFDAVLHEHGSVHSQPSGVLTMAGAAIGGTTGAIIGSSIHDKTDTQTAFLEVKGNDFHKIFEIAGDKEPWLMAPQPRKGAARIAMGIKEAAIEARVVTEHGAIPETLATAKPETRVEDESPRDADAGAGWLQRSWLRHPISGWVDLPTWAKVATAVGTVLLIGASIS